MLLIIFKRKQKVKSEQVQIASFVNVIKFYKVCNKAENSVFLQDLIVLRLLLTIYYLDIYTLSRLLG